MLGDTAGFFSKDFPTDKASQHDYIPLYDKFLAPYRNKNVKIVEIGIKKGGSMKMWREYFSQESMIYGIDIDPGLTFFLIFSFSTFSKRYKHKINYCRLKIKRSTRNFPK